MCSIPSLRCFPYVAFKMVPMSIWLRMALSRPFKKDHLAFLLSTPLLQVINSVMSLALCPLLVSQAPQHFRSSLAFTVHKYRALVTCAICAALSQPSQAMPPRFPQEMTKYRRKVLHGNRAASTDRICAWMGAMTKRLNLFHQNLEVKVSNKWIRYKPVLQLPSCTLSHPSCNSEVIHSVPAKDNINHWNKTFVIFWIWHLPSLHIFFLIIKDQVSSWYKSQMQI